MTDKTREAFEDAWVTRQRYKGIGDYLSGSELVRRGPDGSYITPDLVVAWWAWQAATARAMAEAVRVCEELYALKSEYDKAYTKGQDGAASMIWQSIQKGPSGTPEWVLEEVKCPGGGLFWTNGEKRVHFEWPPTCATPARQIESGGLAWD